MRIQSDFAMIDVKHGRKALAKRLKEGSLEVVIHGKILMVCGNDDGESQEFELEVDKVKVVGT